MGCPPVITHETIVGEAEGVGRVEEAGDRVSSSNDDRSSDEGGNGELLIEDGDDV